MTKMPAQGITDLDARLARGELGESGLPLKRAAARTLVGAAVVLEVTGKPLSAAAALRYLEARYLEEAR